MIQETDMRRIDRLKKQIGAKTKVEVVRAALGLLEHQAAREQRVARWQRAVRIAAAESRRATEDFRPHSRLRRSR